MDYDGVQLIFEIINQFLNTKTSTPQVKPINIMRIKKTEIYGKLKEKFSLPNISFSQLLMFHAFLGFIIEPPISEMILPPAKAPKLVATSSSYPNPALTKYPPAIPPTIANITVLHHGHG